MSRPRRGYAPILGENDPRSRHANDSGIQADAIASPLVRDSQGRVTVKAEGALTTTPSGGIDVNVAHGLAVKTGSPQRIVVRTSKTIVVGRTGDLEARVTALDIDGMESYIRTIVRSAAPDISYAEPLVADAYTDPEAPFLYSEDGTDVLVSEVLH
jgi:hypothetical protein